MSLTFNNIKNDFYVVLEVAPLSTYDDIHKKYRELSKKYHPDLFPDKEVADAKMKQIVEAYNVLKDVETRKLYDSRRMYQIRPYNREHSNYGKQKKGFFANLFAKKEKTTKKGLGDDPVKTCFDLYSAFIKTRKLDSVVLAKSEFEKVLLLDQKNPELHYNLGIINYYVGEYDAAIEYFGNCLKIDPNYPDAAKMVELLTMD